MLFYGACLGVAGGSVGGRDIASKSESDAAASNPPSLRLTPPPSNLPVDTYVKDILKLLVLPPSLDLPPTLPDGSSPSMPVAEKPGE